MKDGGLFEENKTMVFIVICFAVSRARDYIYICMCFFENV